MPPRKALGNRPQGGENWRRDEVPIASFPLRQRRTTDTMSTILNLSEETYQQLADLAQQQRHTLEEMLRICLGIYEEYCFQQAHQQMLADGLLLPLPLLGQAAEADDDFEPEPIPGKPLSEIILEDRR
jgi:hypothetical protein